MRRLCTTFTLLMLLTSIHATPVVRPTPSPSVAYVYAQTSAQITVAQTTSVCYGQETYSQYSNYPTCSTSVTPPTSVSSPTAPPPSYTKVSCQPTPTAFALLEAETDFCNGVRYCDPPVATGAATWAKTGEIRRSEIESLLYRTAETVQVLLNGYGNSLADGFFGDAMVAAGFMFEITFDRRFLDQAVRLADNILALQNDPQTGRVMWTGNRDPVWPTKLANVSTAGYAGCEQGQIAGFMVDAALYILKNPCIWSLVPQPSSGPSTFPVNTTYYDKALAYLSAASNTYENYLLQYFVDPNGLLIQPNDTRWSSTGDIAAGTPMPYNRKSFVYYGLLRLAVAHRLNVNNGTFNDSAKAQYYESLVSTNVRDWVASVHHLTSCSKQTLSWNYVSGSNSLEKIHGIHAFYDLLGAVLAYQQGIATDVLTTSFFQALANTIEYTVYLPAYNLFAANLDGTSQICTWEGIPVAQLDGRWTQLARWTPNIYNILYQTSQGQIVLSLQTSQGQNVSLQNFAGMLWTRVALSRESTAFWTRSKYTQP